MSDGIKAQSYPDQIAALHTRVAELEAKVKELEEAPYMDLHSVNLTLQDGLKSVRDENASLTERVTYLEACAEALHNIVKKYPDKDDLIHQGWVALGRQAVQPKVRTKCSVDHGGQPCTHYPAIPTAQVSCSCCGKAMPDMGPSARQWCSDECYSKRGVSSQGVKDE